jgi:hypothetical protein
MAMADGRRFLVSAVAALSLLAAGSLSAAANEGGGNLLKFHSMTGVNGAALGVPNDRGIVGGGLPWVLRSGRGTVDRHGEVEVRVRGLVIPVPPFNGTNPVPFFKAIVSCLTPGGVVNVSTGNFPATVTGNSRIEETVNVPHPCNQPEVFVTAPNGMWFSESND